jgi:hypothetical protein
MSYELTDDFSTEDMMRLIDVSVESQLKGSRCQLLLIGKPGTGKTDLVNQYKAWKFEHGSKALGIEHPKVGVRVTILAQHSATDFGVPSPDYKNGTLDFLVPNEALGLASGDEENDINIIFWDELPNALGDTLSAWQSLAQGREIRGRKVAPNCVYISAGNRPEDKSGARPLPRSILEGRVTSIPMGVSISRLIEFTERSGWDQRIINVLKWSSDVGNNLIDKPDADPNSKVNPSCRGLETLNNYIQEGVEDYMLDVLGPGAIGLSTWAEIRAFFRLDGDLTTMDEILSDPYTANVPGTHNPENGPSGQYAVISNCANFLRKIQDNEEHLHTEVAESIAKYLDRGEFHDEMTLFGLKLCDSANKDFCKNGVWSEMTVKHAGLSIGTGGN